jgi:hypothetical protein
MTMKNRFERRVKDDEEDRDMKLAMARKKLEEGRELTDPKTIPASFFYLSVSGTIEVADVSERQPMTALTLDIVAG